MKLEEKREKVREYYEANYRNIRFKRDLTDTEVEFLFQKMNLLSRELGDFYERDHAKRLKVQSWGSMTEANAPL